MSYAQVEKEITFETRQIGTTVSGQPINGLQAHTEYRITSYSHDTITNDIALVVRKMKDGYFQNKAYMMVYDIGAKKIKWSEQLKGTSFKFAYNNKEIIQILDRKRVGYSRATGKMIWERLAQPDPVEKITKTGASSGIDYIDFEAHSIKWKNGKETYNWYNAVYLTDSTVIISDFEGLSSINTKTGKGWGYNIPTYINSIDPASTAILNGGGLILGLLTGVYAFGYTTIAAFHICSDIQVDNKLIYFAGREYLYCFDEGGRTIWKTELPEKNTSLSQLYITDTSIILLNRGFALGETTLKYGEPFIASFNKQMGQKHYLHKIEDMPIVSAHYFTPSSAVLFANQDAWRYSYSTGKIIQHKSLPTGFEISGFVNPAYFYKENADNKYTPLKTDEGSLYNIAGDGSITRIDEDLNIRETIASKDVWQVDEKKNGLTIIKNNNKVKLLRENKLLMETSCNKVSIQGSRILLSGHNDLIITDLAQFN